MVATARGCVTRRAALKLATAACVMRYAPRIGNQSPVLKFIKANLKSVPAASPKIKFKSIIMHPIQDKFTP